MRKKVLSFLLLFAMLVNTIFAGSVFASANTVRQSGLSNTLYKIKNKQSLNVAYLGGSITDGYGASDESHSYAKLSFNWLQETYGTPDNVTYNIIKKGVGGTGTTYGAYRAEEDLGLKSESVPDLAFIECAINDSYDGIGYDRAAANMESIVRGLYKANPYMDIIILFTTDIYRFDYQNNTAWNENEWEELKAHKAVADYYGIPTIYMGKALNEAVYKENGNSVPKNANGSVDTSNAAWGKYFPAVSTGGYDTVHPNDTGYGIYKNCIAEYVSGEIDGKTAPGSQQEMKLGGAAFGAYDNPYFATVKAYSPIGNQWKVSGSKIYADGANQVVKFKFTGTSLLLHTTHSIGKNTGYGSLTYYIDGIKYNKTIAENGQAQMLKLAENLSNTEHSVMIVTNENTVPSSKTLEIDKIGISGSDARDGIVFENDTKKLYVTPSKTVKDIDFAEKIDNRPTQITWLGSGTNYVDSSKYVDGGTTYLYMDSSAPNIYRRPMFFKYNLSDFKGKSIVKATFFGKTGNALNFAYRFYDVPSDDLTYMENGSYKRITVSDTKFASVWNQSNGNVSDYLPSDMVSNYNMCVDITSYFKGEAEGNSDAATFMLLFEYADAQKFENPMILVETAEAGDKPIVALTKDKASVLEGESVKVTASSESKLADVRFYVDGSLYNGSITAQNGSFSTDISGLGYGEHKISAVGIDIFGTASDEAEITVTALSSSYSAAPSVLVSTFYGEDSDGNAVGTTQDTKTGMSIGTEWDQGVASKGWQHKKQTSDFTMTEPERVLFAKIALPKLAEGVSIRSAKILMNSPADWHSGMTGNTVYLYELSNVTEGIATWTEGNAIPLKSGEAISDDNYSFKKSLTSDTESFTKDKTGYADNYNIYLDITDFVKGLSEGQEEVSFKLLPNKGANLSFRSDDGSAMTNPVMIRYELSLPISAEITSSASIAPGKPYVLKAKVTGSTGASVEFKVDGTSVGTTQTTDENGEYVLQVTNGLEEGKHVVTATATDNATLSVGTAEKTIFVNGRYNLIPLAEGSGVGYITKEYTYNTSGKDNIFDIAEGGSAILGVSDVDGVAKKTTFSYYQYDVSGIDKSRIENAYIVYATKSEHAQDYVRMDIERIGTYTDKNDAVTKDIIGTVRSFVPATEGNITETDDDYSVIKDIKKQNDAQVLSKLDVTDYIKNLDTNGENLALRFSKYTDGSKYSGVFAIQTTPYIYVTYKQDFIVDNGTSVSVNLRPADYTSTYDKIAVMIAKYNSEGMLINAKVEKDIPVTGAYTCIDADKDNAALIKIFIWNNMENMYPLAKVTEYR